MSEETPKTADLELPEELEQAKDFVTKHANLIMTIALVVAVAVTGLWVYRSRHMRRDMIADQELSMARTAPDFEALLDQYKNTPAAPLALLSLAKLQFDNGNYEAALARYDQFLVEWPTHEMRPTAELGRFFCIEARADESSVREAQAGFESFAASHPDHYLYPQARIGQARCLQQLGQFDEARIIYEDFLADNPDNPWVLQVEEQLASLEKLAKRSQS